MLRRTIAITFALGAAACASAPPLPPPTPVTTFEQKMAWILRLEDQRVLRDPDPPVAVLPPPIPRKGEKAPVVVPPPPPPNLVRLLGDGEARGRRAALAIGRVGLHDRDRAARAAAARRRPEVRQMAAFGPV
jgi:hypothetical protein